MKFSELYPNDWLKADDLDGQDVTLVIKDLQLEELGANNERKPVAYFQGTDKKMAVNVTNGKTVKSLYGGDSDGWIGKAITLFPAEVSFGADTVMGIRIRPQVPEQAPSPVPDQAGAQPEAPPNWLE